MTYINQPFHIKGMELKNRVVMAPMCQYSVEAHDGIPTEWHNIHYASRAIGGTGLIIVEMTNVEPRGRITDRCLGLWSDDHIPAYKQLVDTVHRYGAKIGIQIAHAGRKAQDAPHPVAPSSISVTHDDTTDKPHALTTEEAKEMVLRFKEAAARAVAAGFDCIELHGAHGYLIHQFHSPGINKRDDQYGQDLALFGEEVVQAVRSVMPPDMPLLFRISAMEYMQDGYQVDHAISVARRYQAAGVDCFHVSSGGEGPVSVVRPGNHAAYQVPLAKAFKDAFPDIPVIAVGKLERAAVAEQVLANDEADLIAIGRGMLNDPYWTLHAIKELTGHVQPPAQYERGM